MFYQHGIQCCYSCDLLCSFMQQDDFERRAIWESNMRMIENNNIGFFTGTKMFTMAMNKYGDLVIITCSYCLIDYSVNMFTFYDYKSFSCIKSPLVSQVWRYICSGI